MQITMRPAVPCLLTCLMVAAAPLPAAAQNFPSKPLRIVVPFGPASGSDAVARSIGEALAEVVKVPVVVENREGAGGVIGAQLVAGSAPDGYTLMLASTWFPIVPNLYAKAPYDPNKDFTPVAKVNAGISAVVTSPSSPFGTLKEMAAYIKANPGRASYGTSGKGAQSHLDAAQLMQYFGVTAQDVPYKSTGQALTDTMSGQILFYFPTMSAIVTQVNAGKLRALATTGKQRSPLLPDVPTLAEATGAPGYEAYFWMGFVTPGNTPGDVVGKLYEGIARSMDAPKVRERMAAIGTEVALVPPQQFGAELRAETDKYAKVIKAAGIKPE